MKIIKSKTETLTVRIDLNLKKIINMVCTHYNLNLRQFTELAFIDYIEKIEKEFKLNGIDIKEYVQLKKAENLRNIHKYIRKETKSRHLFIERVKMDIYKYLLYKRNLKEIFELLEIYKKEAKTYKGDIALNEIEKLIKDGQEHEFKSLTYELKQRFSSFNALDFLEKKADKK